MNIVCATDNNFVQHCAVTLVSLLKNTSHKVSVYLLTEGLTPNNEAILKELVSTNEGELFIITVDSEALKNCPMPDFSFLDHISIATYYRLLIPNLLPEDIEKVIYLDCDIVVRHDLKELWSCSISDYAIAAVYQISDQTVGATKRLGYPSKYGYFNAGVLLINLKYWREFNVTDSLLNFLEVNKSSIVFHDQDALNGVLYDKCLRLSIKWNMQNIFLKRIGLTINDVDDKKTINNYEEYKKEIFIHKDNPAIIHYVSKPKPWEALCDHPLKREYYKYLKFTPWKKFKAPHLLGFFINNPFKMYLWLKEVAKKIIYGSPYLKIKLTK